jgi:5-oxoprolinase (ATP-hydrolysing) subunit A
VSYRDLAGFGRRFIDVTAEDLVADLVYQIGALQAMAQASGSAVCYVKPHGALYNTIVTSGQVTVIDGAQIAVSVESVCVHGDSPGALQIATAVRDQLEAAGIDVRSFC